MSSHFYTYCEDHEVYGPGMRRSGRSIPIVKPGHPWPALEQQETAPLEQWHRFLMEHEWCCLSLQHELSVPTTEFTDPPWSAK